MVRGITISAMGPSNTLASLLTLLCLFHVRRKDSPSWGVWEEKLLVPSLPPRGQHAARVLISSFLSHVALDDCGQAPCGGSTLLSSGTG